MATLNPNVPPARSQADLVQKVLEKLFVVPEGQAAETDDTSRVTANVQSAIDALGGREEIYVPDVNNIPPALFLDLAKVIAYELKDEFGLSGEMLQKCSTANTEGLRNLRIMSRGRPTYEPLKTLSY